MAKLILGRAVNIAIALLIVPVAWGVVVTVLASIPGTPHAELPQVVSATAQAKSDAGLQRFMDHGRRLQAWNAVAIAVLAGLAIGVVSRRWLHLRMFEVLILVCVVALFKWSDYQPCCVDIWDFVGPLLLGATILLTSHRAQPAAT